ncbi:Teichoic acid translocation permease TagG [Vagococcus penaei]|uniref:Transport permease protein n=1 Tax=Vagococcus penaei TaxID=633807 RepID=A0A1Q2D410_9ENTE|nr:ABC transporter permease [Vagococcus penaei]AQP53108.1 Teichoic acid translocation permease TagG [Vagococcus penaei]RSU06030.1 Teichoic acid translocation permease TagG [Vagococcus penaei]
MNDVKTVLLEQFQNFGITRRISKYEEKATYQSHYLGLIWQFLNPAIQIGIYYLVFGIGLSNGREEDGVPYIVWMLIGIIAWFFINSSILGGSNSIYKQVGMVSKMKFPVSILPTVNMASNFVSYRAMMVVLLATMFGFGVYPTIYWLQYLYYFFCMIAFLFAFGILNSTITVLVRDYHIMLQSVLRLLFYISGPIWNFSTNSMFKGRHAWFIHILELNPIYYIINGFRDSFLSRAWFWEKGTQTIFFWLIVMVLMIIGSHIHMKFRARFVDFI